MTPSLSLRLEPGLAADFICTVRYLTLTPGFGYSAAKILHRLVRLYVDRKASTVILKIAQPIDVFVCYKH